MIGQIMKGINMEQPNISLKCRRQLSRLLQFWTGQGLITEDQADRISEMHQLEEAQKHWRQLLLNSVYGVGIVLVLVGVVSFVAFHWDIMGRWAKVGLLVAAMLICHIGGYYLWKVNPKFPRLGHALVTLGTLLLGANIGLMAQIFHISGRPYMLFAMWSVGAAAMAFATGSVPNAAVAAVTSFIAFADQPFNADQVRLWYYPYIVAAVLGGFAFLHRSAIVFTLTMLALLFSQFVFISSDLIGPWFLVVSGLSLCSLFFSLGHILSASENCKQLAAPGVFIGIAGFIVISFMTSHFDFAKEIIIDFSNYGKWAWIYSIPGFAALGATIILSPHSFNSIAGDRPMALLSIAMKLFLLLLALGPVLTNQYIVAGIGNTACLVLAAGLIYIAQNRENRGIFWAGMAVIALVILMRTLEYQTNLLVKSAGFTAAGAALIAGGWIFEYAMRKRSMQNA